MANYTIRIVLHGATAGDYQRLHDAMEHRGAKRFLIGTDQVAYDLPDGEYDLETGYDTEEVRDRVVAIAASVRSDPSVLVTRVSGPRMWRLCPVPGDS